MTKTASELSHLFRSLKAPAAARALPVLADRAREEQWSYERFAEILLGTEVSARESHGGEGRIKTARFPARKTLEEFDFTFQRSVKKQVVEHLGQLDFLHGKQNVILLGPPGTGKTHLAIALSIRACLAGQRAQFATATEWVARLSEAKRQDNLETELRRLSFIPLLVIDEVGYIPFDPEAASLMFSLVSNRYERASMIVTFKQAVQQVGRHLRRRHGRHRDDRPADPPLRDPLAQRRQLPPARQRARRPPTGETPRDRLTDPPRRPRRGPQNAAQHADPLAGPRQTGLKRPSPLRLRPTGSASRRRSLSPQLTQRGQFSTGGVA